MGQLSLFLKANKKVRANVKYAATRSLCGEDGNPLEWEIRPLTTRESEKIRERCTRDIPVTGKPGMYRQKFDSEEFVAELLSCSVVYPDLNDAELQDSYGVCSAPELIREMVDDPGEYNAFAEFVQNFNSFDRTLADDVEEAKN